MPAFGTWEPIATAPKSTSTLTRHGKRYVAGVYFLAFCPDQCTARDPTAGVCVCWWEPNLNGGRWQGEGGFELRPTHWMPLPPLPLKGF